MKNFLLLSILAITLSLQGCIPAVVGGAAVGGSAYYNRNSISNFYQDTSISDNIMDKIHHDPTLKNTHIIVDSKNGNVILVGEVLYPSQRIRAEQLASSYPGIKRIYNEITISGPSASLTRSSDTWISSKVKARLFVKDYLPSGKIKVVTEDGTVYLMGTITRAQGEMASNVARQVAGVQRVVKLFEYTD